MLRNRVFALIMVLLLFLAGCASDEAEVTSAPTSREIEETQSTELPETEPEEDLEAYMTSIREQSELIKASLAQDPLSQYELNAKSLELFELWDGALNHIWDALERRLSDEEFAVLQEQQRAWVADKEKAVEEAGMDFQGGSLYPLIVNGEAAAITEERVWELYELLK